MVPSLSPPNPTPAAAPTAADDVLRLRDIGCDAPRALLVHFELQLIEIAEGQPIPGSYWGDDEAGVIASGVYARPGTPVHSLLHEACHLIVLPRERRAEVHTNATDSVIEEDATCYLQILLADCLPGVGRERLMADMDSWGYTFRLGSTRAWFERDAEDARAFLEQRGLPASPSAQGALLPLTLARPSAGV